MGYAQFIQLEVFNKSKKRTYKIQNANLAWGKFYENPNKDKEISRDQVNKFVIGPTGKQIVASCGRESASSGTEGSIEVWEDSTKVGTIHWDNPWAAGKSNSVWADVPSESPYSIAIGPYATSGPAIGYVQATVVYSD